MKYLISALFSIPLLGLVGCTAADIEEGETESSSSTLLSHNALSHNALSHNALSHNALSHNALSHNALDAESLDALKDPGPEGDLYRSFLSYTVGCALDSSQSYAFSWTDSSGTLHEENYVGELGLAPTWASGPLDVPGQELVSACLAARTNWYGVSVVISMRSSQEPLRSMTRREELAEYRKVEGAFWGNVFSATPHLSACYRHENTANSRAARRDCAVGHLDGGGAVEACGMIALVGNCGSRCKVLSGGQNYPECYDNNFGRTANVITTALR